MPPRTRKRQVAQDQPDPEQPVTRRSNLRELMPPPEADLEVCIREGLKNAQKSDIYHPRPAHSTLPQSNILYLLALILDFLHTF